MANPIRMGRENIGPCQFVKVILGNQDRPVRVVNVQEIIESVEPIISGCQSFGALEVRQIRKGNLVLPCKRKNQLRSQSTLKTNVMLTFGD